MRFWIIIFLLLGFFTAKSQTKRALITGIGEYPVKSGWHQINGDKDVPLISDVLIQRGFDSGNIVSLVNEEATKENILNKFSHLTKEARQNDIIYIHFSTHGQQVVDLNDDEEDGLDEAIIPFDAQKSFVKGQYEGENHLVDDELYELLSALRNKIGETGTLLVVIDACHSGDATRGELKEDDEVIFRGTSEIFKAEKTAVYELRNSETIEWVVISATQPHQNNYEYKINRSYYGSLSYAVKLALTELNNEANFVQLFELIQMKRREMDVARYPQRPMIEGNNIYQIRKFSDPMKLTDKEIISAIRSRNEYLTGKIYRMYRDEFLGFLKKELWYDEDYLLDIFHDAFLDMCNNIYENKINENNLSSSIKTYLFSIGKYKVYNLNRKKGNLNKQIFNEIPDLYNEEPEFDEQSELLIRKAVKEMGEPCHTILIKQYWENKSGDIIAVEMNYKNKDTLKTQKYKCIQKLKKELKKKIVWQN